MGFFWTGGQISFSIFAQLFTDWYIAYIILIGGPLFALNFLFVHIIKESPLFASKYYS